MRTPHPGASGGLGDPAVAFAAQPRQTRFIQLIEAAPDGRQILKAKGL